MRLKPSRRRTANHDTLHVKVHRHRVKIKRATHASEHHSIRDRAKVPGLRNRVGSAFRK